jgi:hypothetical protein
VFTTEKPSDVFRKILLLENRLLRDLRLKNHNAEVEEAAAADARAKNISDVTERSRSR